MRQEVRFAGFGGQGIVLSGVILGTAASQVLGKYSAQTQSYGPEARGGACKSEVIISDEAIDYPMALELGTLLAMNQESLDKYIGELQPGGTLIVDSDLVPNVANETNYKVHRVPATRVAEEELGRRIVANIVMLGALVAVTGVVTLEALETAVRRMVPKGTEDINARAVKRGYELGFITA